MIWSFLTKSQTLEFKMTDGEFFGDVHNFCQKTFHIKLIKIFSFHFSYQTIFLRLKRVHVRQNVNFNYTKLKLYIFFFGFCAALFKVFIYTHGGIPHTKESPFKKNNFYLFYKRYYITCYLFLL